MRISQKKGLFRLFRFVELNKEKENTRNGSALLSYKYKIEIILMIKHGVKA